MINHIYGQALNLFEVFRNETRTDDKGRVIKGQGTCKGCILGTLTSTSQKERERFMQLGHDCSHKVVTKNITDIKAGDTLQMKAINASDKDRKLYVIEKRNPASLDAWEVIFVNELMSND